MQSQQIKRRSLRPNGQVESAFAPVARQDMGGHGDAVGGAVAGPADLVKQMRLEASIHHGGVLSPFNAWLIARGASTLPLRMRAHQQGALAVAEWLEAQPSVTRVLYPGLPSHPQFELAARQMSAGGTVLTVDVGDKDRAFRFLDTLELFDISNNVGDSKSLATHPATTTHRRIGAEGRAAVGIGDGMVRLSVGLEDVDDLYDDLTGSLDSL